MLRSIWNAVDALLVYSFGIGFLCLMVADIIRVILNFIFGW